MRLSCLLISNWVFNYCKSFAGRVRSVKLNKKKSFFPLQISMMCWKEGVGGNGCLKKVDTVVPCGMNASLYEKIARQTHLGPQKSSISGGALESWQGKSKGTLRTRGRALHVCCHHEGCGVEKKHLPDRGARQERIPEGAKKESQTLG